MPQLYAQHLAQYVVRKEMFGPFQVFLIGAEQLRRDRRRPRIQACGTRVVMPALSPLESIERPAA
ncbi:hypothetical protein CQ14_02175 [Bradyrhizobium lablabi]|uniref:Uncharacterized protein n=1 Tax=Bradyrhizobium lablabi TaxID=722472 RepID=A0A0R3N7S4_9BRAD|nr:hypothetical protein CQ14_02175 [Bradyrhizobium lablabi]